MIIEGFIPEGDLDAIRRLGDDWDREITYVPIVHPNNAENMERVGYEGKPVKVTVRIEIEGEPKCEEEAE